MRHDRDPVWVKITTDPDTALLPGSKMACAMHTASLVERVDAESMPAVMQYVRRMDEEWQFMFAALLAKSPTKCQLAFDSKAFCDWVVDHQNDL